MTLASSAACRTASAAAIVALSAVCALASPGVVNTTVNLRLGPGTNTAVLAKIPGGAAVDVTGCRGQWCQVTFAGKSGYVIATALGHGGPPPGAPPPGYVPPPAVVYVAPPPYYYGPYYGPYGGWGGGGCCWRGGWGRRW